MIDFNYLIELLNQETERRNKIYKKERETALNEVAGYKLKINECVDQIQSKIETKLTTIEQKDQIMSIYSLLTDQKEQMNQEKLQIIGQALSDLLIEEIDMQNSEKEVFKFPPLNNHKNTDIKTFISQIYLATSILMNQDFTKQMFESINFIINQQKNKENKLLLTVHESNHNLADYSVCQWDTKTYSILKPITSIGYVEDFNLQIQNLQILVSVNKQFQLKQQLYGHTESIRQVGISVDNKYIASGSSGNNEVFLWDIQTNKLLQKYLGPQYILSLCFSQDNKLLAAAGSGPFDIFIFNIQDLSTTKPIPLKGHANNIVRTTFMDDSKFLVSASWDNTLRVWDVIEQKEISQRYFGKNVNGLSVSNRLDLIVCCCDGGQVYICCSKQFGSSLNILATWQAHKPDTYCIEFMQDSLILVTSGKTEIRLWQVQDALQKNQLKYFKEILNDFNDIIWTIKSYPIQDPKVLVACDGKIKIWNIYSGQLKQTIDIVKGLIGRMGYQFIITSDFRTIVTGGNDKTIKIYQR